MGHTKAQINELVDDIQTELEQVSSDNETEEWDGKERAIKYKGLRKILDIINSEL